MNINCLCLGHKIKSLSFKHASRIAEAFFENQWRRIKSKGQTVLSLIYKNFSKCPFFMSKISKNLKNQFLKRFHIFSENLFWKYFWCLKKEIVNFERVPIKDRPLSPVRAARPEVWEEGDCLYISLVADHRDYCEW